MSMSIHRESPHRSGAAHATRRTSVFVTVGTDHHPFQRLVDWADRLAADPTLDVTVQYGSARAPQRATGHAALPHPEVLRLMREADVVVAQGGPGGIMDARACGRLPIVVPRDPRLGEHVDDHQQRFAAHLARRGTVALASDETALTALVRGAIHRPAGFTVAPQESPTAATGQAIEASLVAVLHRAGRRPRRPGRLDRFRRTTTGHRLPAAG